MIIRAGTNQIARIGIGLVRTKTKKRGVGYWRKRIGYQISKQPAKKGIGLGKEM